jgi:hypothetical protein
MVDPASAATQPRPVLPRPVLPWLRVLAWAPLLALLGWQLQHYASYAIEAFRYPFELDYGEGIVWQQALLIPGPRMYGDITGLPALVFHYPPGYHLAVRAVAAFEVDWLPAGRGVSLASTLAIALLVGAVARLACRDAERVTAWFAALVAALMVFTLDPVVRWSPFMRVDMFGVALTWLGLLLGLLALRRPWLLHGAMVVFVAAACTKQTLILAPVAVLAGHLLRNPRQALWAGLTGLATGLAVLGWLSWATDGGFLRHILFYNVNRFEWRNIPRSIYDFARPFGLTVLLAGAGFLCVWGRLLREPGAIGQYHRQRGENNFFVIFILSIYLALTSLGLVMVGKSGAYFNYFIEWGVVLCAWIGILLGVAGCFRTSPRSRDVFLIACLCILALQVALGRPWVAITWPDRSGVQNAALLQRAREINGPILSDNMVLLLQTGREVVLEPAIIAELSATGLWDGRRLTELIEQHYFSAIITWGDPSSSTMQARYTPEAIAALVEHYPIVSRYGYYRLRLPR